MPLKQKIPGRELSHPVVRPLVTNGPVDLPLRAYKVELDPNNRQTTHLRKHAGAARFVWNWALARRIEEYKTTGKSSNAYSQDKEITKLKQSELSWLYGVSRHTYGTALRNLDVAFKNFYRRCKEKKGKPGYPRFKSRHKGYGSFTLYGTFHVAESGIQLPKLGVLRLKQDKYLPMNTRIRSATVSERAGHWFVSVLVQEPIKGVENKGPVVGIDVGLNTFATLSNGQQIQAPKPLLRAMRRLRKTARAHARKKKGSNNRRKATRRLSTLHYNVACQRADFLHKLSTKLAKTKSVIVVEYLNVAGMVRNHKLARSITDAGWSEFSRQLEYKTKWYGSTLVKADRFFPSTKRCSACGNVKEAMPLSERVYHCDICGLTMDRDHNAARNLRWYHTARPAEIQACGEDIRPTGAVLVEAGTEPSTGILVSEVRNMSRCVASARLGVLSAHLCVFRPRACGGSEGAELSDVTEILSPTGVRVFGIRNCSPLARAVFLLSLVNDTHSSDLDVAARASMALFGLATLIIADMEAAKNEDE